MLNVRVAVFSMVTVLTLSAGSESVVIGSGNEPASANAGSTIDFARAIPKVMSASIDLPDSLTTLLEQSVPPRAAGNGRSAATDGREGSGKVKIEKIPLPASSGGIAPQEYGDEVDGVVIPYTTSRVDMYGKVDSNRYPYRATGKLYFTDDGQTYVCSASLIKRGVIVTAAHCVAEFGDKEFYKNWVFVPGMRGGVAPYGKWYARRAYVMRSYYNGSDECAYPGVVCKNDVAVIVLKRQGGLPGTRVGWYGYGWNGYGYAKNASVTQITQLGYPVSHDRGVKMQRNDSAGIATGSDVSYNTLIGSRMTGGSSGGPWLVNFGEKARLAYGTNVGHDAKRNIIVGVTSWGYVDDAYKIQGASPFTSHNIVNLVKKACSQFPAQCRQ